MADVISEHPGRAIAVVVERAGKRVDAHGHAAATSTARARSASRRSACRARSPCPAAKEAAHARDQDAADRGQATSSSASAQLVAGKAEGELSGPVGMVQGRRRRSRRSGWTDLLGFLGHALGVPRRVQPPPLPGARRRAPDVPRLRGDDAPPAQRAHRGAHPPHRPRDDARPDGLRDREGPPAARAGRGPRRARRAAPPQGRAPGHRARAGRHRPPGSAAPAAAPSAAPRDAPAPRPDGK